MTQHPCHTEQSEVSLFSVVMRSFTSVQDDKFAKNVNVGPTAILLPIFIYTRGKFWICLACFLHLSPIAWYCHFSSFWYFVEKEGKISYRFKIANRIVPDETVLNIALWLWKENNNRYICGNNNVLPILSILLRWQD